MTDIPVVVEATTRQFESWKGVAVIAEKLGSSGWALAGGQMVALHLLMADLPFPRVTIDADTIVDVRARPDAARLASTGLVGAGWVGSGVDNVVHRFTSSTGGVVDILGPDGLRSQPITIPPATTLLAPGGTQLLRRASGVVISIRNGTRSISDLNVPLPSRLAALIGKSAALGLPRRRRPSPPRCDPFDGHASSGGPRRTACKGGSTLASKHAGTCRAERRLDVR